MELGVILPSMSRRDGRPGDVPAAARQAEELGFESAWVVDQLVAGTGVPVLDSLTSLAGAATVTSRIRLGVGVLIVPLRPVAWTAKQVATLQYLSGDRVLLGIGAGGDRHAASWDAAGVPRRERGRRTDEVLRRLPDLIAGRPAQLTPDGAEVTLSPGVTVPPIVIGGNSDAAARRAGEFGDEWFVLAGPGDIPGYQAKAAEQAARFGRPAPAITTSVMVALDGDPSVPDRDTLISLLADPDGMFGIPAGAAPDAYLPGGPSALADHLGALASAGVHRTIIQFVTGSWSRQAALAAEAWSRLPQDGPTRLRSPAAPPESMSDNSKKQAYLRLGSDPGMMSPSRLGSAPGARPSAHESRNPRNSKIHSPVAKSVVLTKSVTGAMDHFDNSKKRRGP